MGADRLPAPQEPLGRPSGLGWGSHAGHAASPPVDPQRSPRGSFRARAPGASFALLAMHREHVEVLATRPARSAGPAPDWPIEEDERACPIGLMFSRSMPSPLPSRWSEGAHTRPEPKGARPSPPAFRAPWAGRKPARLVISPSAECRPVDLPAALARMVSGLRGWRLRHARRRARLRSAPERMEWHSGLAASVTRPFGASGAKWFRSSQVDGSTKPMIRCGVSDRRSFSASRPVPTCQKCALRNTKVHQEDAASSGST